MTGCAVVARLSRVFFNRALYDRRILKKYLALTGGRDMQAPRVRPHEDIVRRVQGEFLEMPGLRLTEPQARKLWALEPSLCSAVLTELVNNGFLLRTRDGAFVRVDVMSPLKAGRYSSRRSKISAA
jgi:hypothetical protein